MPEDLQKYCDALDAVHTRRIAMWSGELGKTRKPACFAEFWGTVGGYFQEDYADAELELKCAIMREWHPAIEKLKHGRRIPDRNEVRALFNDWVAKDRKANELVALGIEFCLPSEITAAKTRAICAHLLLDVAIDRNDVKYGPSGVSTYSKLIQQCRAPKSRPVIEGVDGNLYVKTSRYIWVDGERLPELEPVK